MSDFLRVSQLSEITVRADASTDLGYGHVYRTLSVIARLREASDVRVRYLMTANSDAAPVWDADCEVERLPDCSMESLLTSLRPVGGPLVVDTYTVDAGHLRQLRRGGHCTAVFDDNRRLDHYPSDVVIDCAPGADTLGYEGSRDTRFCLGPAYFPLRPQFLERRHPHRGGTAPVRLAVAFGGSDPADQTARVLRVLSQRQGPWQTTAILGPGYAGRAEAWAARDGSVRLRRSVSDMAEAVADSDLAICGGGGTSLEFAYLGVPMVMIVLSEDQRRTARGLADGGAAASVGWYEDVSDDEVWSAVHALAAAPCRRREMGEAGKRLVDGRGADRIARTIVEAWSRRARTAGNGGAAPPS